MTFELGFSFRKKKAEEALYNLMEAADKIAPVSNVAHRMFQSAPVTLANRLISDCTTHYANLAYLKTRNPI